jgi:hypothetical protein
MTEGTRRKARKREYEKIKVKNKKAWKGKEEVLVHHFT